MKINTTLSFYQLTIDKINRMLKHLKKEKPNTSKSSLVRDAVDEYYKKVMPKDIPEGTLDEILRK